MLLRNKLKARDERLDRLRREVLLAVKVSEEEIGAAAGSPDLYDDLRLRISAEREQQHGQRTSDDRRSVAQVGLNLLPAPWARHTLRWTLTATAILLLAAMAALLLLPKQSGVSTQIAPSLPQTVPPPAGGVQTGGSPSRSEPGKPQVVRLDPGPGQPRRTRLFHRRPSRVADEVATDFLPLTFTADSTLPQSVVRIRIHRTALIAFGLPMNVERAGELIKADVVIGDDGLARAIRFIQ